MPTTLQETAGTRPLAGPALRVLIIEDDAPLRRANEMAVRRLGSEVLSVDRVTQALESLGWHPSHAFVDLDLPGEPGTTFLRQVRRRALPVRVAIATASHDRGLLHEVAELKPEVVYGKPFSLRDLDPWLRPATLELGSVCPAPEKTEARGHEASPRTQPAYTERRLEARVAYRVEGVTATIVEGGVGGTRFQVIPRDLSRRGVGFLCGCLVLPGTLIVVELPAAGGAGTRAPARVVSCCRLGGVRHRVSARFDHPLAPGLVVRAGK
jgi:CheY-like chemotaxis protein